MLNNRGFITPLAFATGVVLAALAGALALSHDEGPILGAPTLTQQRTILPETDNLYDLGTSTKYWRDLFVNEICLAGDCQTSWAAGTADGTWSTTSADYWQTVRNFFSTTSADYWYTQQSVPAGFSTTSADYWKTVRDFFSTTSADYWETQQPARKNDWSLTTNVFSQSALTPTTTQNLDINGIGTSTFAGGLEAWRQIAAPYFHATSSTDVSAFEGHAYFAQNVCIGTTNCTGADLTISSAASFQAPISNATIHVIGSNNNPVRAVFDTNNASNAFGTLIQGRRSRGPAATPSAVTGGDVLLQLAGAGYGTTGYVSSNGSKGIIAIKGDGTWTDTNSPTRIEFFTVPNSSVTNALRFTVASSGAWGIGGNASQVISDADFGDSGEAFLSQGAAAAPAWVDVWTQAENTAAAYISDITGESIEDLNDVAAMTKNYGDLLFWNGSTWTDIATSSLGLTFSTTSADFWETQQTARTADDLTNNQIDDLSDVAALSETLGDVLYWNGSSWIDIATSSLGLTFSTTSANYWETQQTARTADDLTDNSIEDLNDVAAMTENYGDLLFWNGTTWTDIATSSLALNFTDIIGTVTDAQVPNTITLDNITQITSRAISDTTGTLAISRGGTGSTTAPVGHLIYGGSTAYQSVPTTTVSCSGSTSCTSFVTLGSTPITITSSAGVQAVGTSSVPTRGALSYWTSSGSTPETLGSVATTTLVAGSNITLSATPVILGSSPITISATGGSGNMSGWATSTISSQLILYPVNGSTTDVILGGEGSTTTAPFFWDVSDASMYIGTSTLKSAAWRDADMVFGPSGDEWTIGYDKTDSSFALASSTALGTTNVFAIAKSTLLTTFNYAVTIVGNLIATAAVDFGGATSFEIPNGTNPTVDAIGEMALDTTANQLLVATSTNASYPAVVPLEQPLFSVTIGSTTPEFINNGTIPISRWIDQAREITRFECFVKTGTSKVVNVTDGTNDTETITCGTTATSDTDVGTNSTFTADELWYVEFGATTGSVDYVTFTAYGYVSRQ